MSWQNQKRPHAIARSHLARGGLVRVRSNRGSNAISIRASKLQNHPGRQSERACVCGSWRNAGLRRGRSSGSGESLRCRSQKFGCRGPAPTNENSSSAMGLAEIASKRAEKLIVRRLKELKTDDDSNVHFPVDEICTQLRFFIQTGESAAAAKLLKRALRELPSWPGLRGGFATSDALTMLANELIETPGKATAIENASSLRNPKCKTAARHADSPSCRMRGLDAMNYPNLLSSVSPRRWEWRVQERITRFQHHCGERRIASRCNARPPTRFGN